MGIAIRKQVKADLHSGHRCPKWAECSTTKLRVRIFPLAGLSQGLQPAFLSSKTNYTIQGQLFALTVDRSGECSPEKECVTVSFKRVPTHVDEMYRSGSVYSVIAPTIW